MSLDKETWIGELRIDIMMGFQSVGKTVKKIKRL